MIPSVKIGRHELHITSVLTITKRSGWRACLRAGYDVLLNNGRTLHFTHAEKAQHDHELGSHQKTMQVYAMAKAAGARGA